jgi:2-octaprenyl-6-methoxyphenol hydroxylase
MPEVELNTDVLIIGAGPVGMTLALALAGGMQRVLLVDRRPRGAWAGDPRALALSHGSRQLLEGFRAWNARAATAIRQIHVSQRGGFGRTLIDAKDYDTPALGYVMRYSDLADELDARLGSGILAPCTVDTIDTDHDAAVVTVTYEGHTKHISARLVVHAEGTPDNEAEVKVHDYRQHAVVAEVNTTTGHQQRAWERFTPDGPLALLPLDDGYSIVFTVPPEKAERLLAMDDSAFLTALREQFGRRIEFTACRARASFPLALRVRSPLVSQRQVWIGNAAQSLHPVSGQGFNLGLRDAWELSQILAEILHRHADVGDSSALAAYARGRALDRRGSMAFTDGIVRLFSNDIPPLRVARGLGLLALDLAPPLRHFVARRMIWGARAWL